MFQVVRTVLQEERRDPGVPTPKARQVFTLLWNQSFGSDYIFNYSRKHFHFDIHQYNVGCERFGNSRGAKITLQVLFENLVDIGSNHEG